MKTFNGILGLFLVVGFLLTPAPVRADKDYFNHVLDLYRGEITDLKELKDNILKNIGSLEKRVVFRLKLAKAIQSELERYENFRLSSIDRGERYCYKAGLLHREMIALSTTMVTQEALVNTKIDLAKGRKINCQTSEDEVFIKNNYQAAQDALETMAIAKETAMKNLVSIDLKCEYIKKINDKLNQTDGNWWKEQRREYNDALRRVSERLDELKNWLKDAEEVSKMAQKLKASIEEDRQAYTKDFPNTWPEFEPLISEVRSISLNLTYNWVNLSDRKHEYEKMQTAFDSYTAHDIHLFSGDPPLINCFSNKVSQKVKDKIDAAFIRARLAIKANQNLINDCQQGSSAPPITTSEETAELPSGGGTPPNIPPVTTTSSNPPVKSSFGGLIIAGPTQITVGQGVSYVACDGDGQPYTTGNFSWNHSREDILVLPRSGNPVTGTAFKPGKVTMFVKYEGMKAYLDIEIKPKEEENLFGSFGGEDDTDSDENLFSTAGGEEGNSENSELSSSPGDATMQSDGQFQQKCNNLVDLIVWSLNRHDADSAQTYTNQAVALGCDINTAEVDRVVSQIEDTKKREQQQQAQQQQQVQNNTPRQPQNQITLLNTMNMIVKGLQSAQNGHNQPSRKPSHTSNPLPTADSIWQSRHPQPTGGSGQVSSSQNDHDTKEYNRVLNMCRDGNKGLSMKYAQNRYKPLTCEEIANYYGYGICPSWAIECTGRSKSPSNNKPTGPVCQGHTLTCNRNYGTDLARTLDTNNDGICDICKLPYKHSNKVHYVLKEKGLKCEEKK